jgi:hypothetical protein
MTEPIIQDTSALADLFNDLHQMLPKVEWSDSETELLAVSWMQWLALGCTL